MVGDIVHNVRPAACLNANNITMKLCLKINNKLQLFSDLGQINTSSKSESPFQVPIPMGASVPGPIKRRPLTSL